MNRRYLRYAVTLALMLAIAAPVILETPAAAGGLYMPAVDQVLIVNLIHTVYKTVNVLLQICTTPSCSSVVASATVTLSYPSNSQAQKTFFLSPGTYYVRTSGYGLPVHTATVTLPPSPQAVTIYVDVPGASAATITSTNTATATVAPTVQVTLIPEDDEVRNMGIIVQGQTVPAGWTSAGLPSSAGTQLFTTYKILISFNGVPVSPKFIFCQFLEKVPFNPSSKQFSAEQLATAIPDQSSDFVCKGRFGFPGVGVLDVYYIGPTGSSGKQFIADYELVLVAGVSVGTSTIFGTGIQDTCLLGFSMASYAKSISLPDGGTATVWDNPMGPFQGCEQAVLAQRSYLGVSVSSTPP